MTEKEKRIILPFSEDEHLEIKKGANGFPNDAWETYSAFANTDGGLIMLGFEEISPTEYLLVGVKNPEKIISDFTNSLQNPSIVNRNLLLPNGIKVEEMGGKKFIGIIVPRATYNQRPIYLKGNMANSFKRIGANDYKLSEEEIKIMMRDASPTSQDSTIIDDVEYDKALDAATIKSYRQRFITRNPDHSFNSLTDEEFLIKIRAIEEKNGVLYPTLAGLLMLGKTIQILKHLPYFLLEFISYQDGSDRWDDRVIYDGTWGEGNLYNFYVTTIPKLMGTAKSEFSLAKDGVTRNEYSDLQIALREAFINSLIHADYRIEDRIQISCTSKDYTFSNPGSLRISIEEFYAGKTSYPRNPGIAFMFRMIGLAEEAGSGVTAILKATKSYRLPRPELDTTDEKVRLIIKTEPLLDVLTAQYHLSEREFLVLKAINDFTYIKRTDIEHVTKLSRNITLQTINTLLDKGLIRQIGKSSATKYTISEEHIDRKEKAISLLEQLLDYYKNE